MDDSSPPTPELPERKNRLSSTSGIKRNKVSRACDECRKRKVRCDGAQPCARCQKSSTECIFSNVTPKRGPPKQYLEPFEARLKTIDTVLQVLELSCTNVKKEELTSWEIKDPAIEANTHLDVNSIGHALYIPDYPARMDRIEELHNIKHLHTEPPQPNLNILTTTRHDYLQAYFDHIHPFAPFISKTILTQPQPSSILLNSIYAVVSRFIPNDTTHTTHSTNSNDPPGWSYYKTAFNLIDAYSDVPRLSTVQALLLLAKYLEHIHRPGFFWRTRFFMQLAVKMSNTLGLSIEPSLDIEPAWDHEFEERRRTFWAVYTYDILMSTEQGSQAQFQHEKCTVKYPHVLSEESSHDANAVLNFYWLSKVIHTQAAVLQFMRSKYGGGDENEDNFIVLEKSVMDLGNCLPHQDNSLQSTFTQLIYHLTSILLFRPYALSSEETQPVYISRCLSSASNITHIIDHQLDKQGINSFYSVPRGNQQIIYCLTAAVTIQRAFRNQQQQTTNNDSINEIHEKTSSLIHMLLVKSPVTEIENTVQQDVSHQQPQWLENRTELASNSSSTRSSPLIPTLSYPHSPNLPTPTVRKRHSRSSLQFTTSDENYVLQSSSTFVPDMMNHNSRMRSSTNRSPYANNRLSAPALGSLYQQSPYFLQMQQQQQQQQMQQQLHMSSYSQPSSPTTSQFGEYNNNSSFPATPRRTTSLSRKTGLRRSASSTGEFVVPSQQRASNRGPYINPRRHTLTNSTPPDLSQVTQQQQQQIPPSPRNLHAMAVRNINRFSAPVMSNHTQLPYTIPITHQQQQHYQQQQSMMLDPSFPMDPVIPDSPNESMMGLLLNPWEFPPQQH